ncbi:MAG: hypothetical protein ABI585_14170 [Betaproteobacteria bacterium]
MPDTRLGAPASGDAADALARTAVRRACVVIASIVAHRVRFKPGRGVEAARVAHGATAGPGARLAFTLDEGGGRGS